MKDYGKVLKFTYTPPPPDPKMEKWRELLMSNAAKTIHDIRLKVIQDHEKTS